MITNLEIKRDKNLITSTVADYKPNDDVKEVTEMVMNHFNIAAEIHSKPYKEFNNKSLIERMSEDQRSWNIWQEPDSENPDEQWRSNAVKPIVRNRAISIAAHITSDIQYPKIFAQNDQDDEDKDAASVMRDLLEYVGEQSEYEKTYLYATIAALVNPGVIVHTEYREMFRNIKRRDEKGKLNKETIIDDILSGFRDATVPLDEFYIGNIYEHNIQKQPFLIWRKVIDYTTAESKYFKNKNWKYIKPGLQLLFDKETESFYEEYDDDLEGRLVEEVIYWNRQLDLKLRYVNGVLMDQPDEPNPRQDKKYPFAKTGYELYDEGKFFYYMSLANKTSKDEKIVNTLYRMIIDGTFLQIMPPMALFGNEELSSSVVMPGKVTQFQDSTNMTEIGNNGNLTAGMNMLNKIEDSINESSQAPRQMGMGDKKQTTAYEVSQLEKNAMINLGLFGQMMGYLVTDLASLKISDICQYMTLGEVGELVSDAGMLKFSKIIMPNKRVDGKNKTKIIDFNGDFNPEMSEEQYLKKSFKLLDQEGLDNEKMIYEVNAEFFRSLKYKVYVDAGMITPKSDNIQKALNLEAYDRAIQNPLANQESIFRDLLLGSYDETKDDPDKYINTGGANLQQAILGKNPNPAGRSNPVNSVNQAEKNNVR